ncbi:hypothetical protein ACIGB6_00695 [Paeniglutamicibacter gangotriensis]|uniref:hypothetical protein n=1 Tax=Paeniglutamicibacter gangotriensis TaxID=254787 RepID=UPI0037CA1474
MMIDVMNLPDWKTSNAGTRIRAALWLASEIGEGGVFTKARLREAFPGVEQIDRRMRDLRKDDWVFSTYAQERSLAVDELRLVKIGGPVWEVGYRSTTTRTVSDRERRDTLARDNFACVFCGIGAGQTYSADPAHSGQLSVTWCGSAGPAGRYVTSCKLCRNPLDGADSSNDAFDAAARLDPAESQVLAQWIAAGYRTPQKLDKAWTLVRLLSKAQRDDLLRRLEPIT